MQRKTFKIAVTSHRHDILSLLRLHQGVNIALSGVLERFSILDFFFTVLLMKFPSPRSLSRSKRTISSWVLKPFPSHVISIFWLSFLPATTWYYAKKINVRVLSCKRTPKKVNKSEAAFCSRARQSKGRCKGYMTKIMHVCTWLINVCMVNAYKLQLWALF